ncbi:TetR family transcriptional regulator [Streptomyces sp. NBC_01190]|uniref:TetR family transcriptional regulator n=1 Tax=Streptomyces sp. NBC_01190 TaxID=2903767 RepID=UPI0038695BEE|nr:TetR family transcriptional regulator [Streptomyces sp. NBC_01190]
MAPRTAQPVGGAGPATAARPAPLPLTERQEARRRHILDASTRLACRGGFDAVQMREVAEISGVALGTLYRYFPSKVHLLVATMEDQLRLLRRALRARPPAAAAPADRAAETLLRAFRALQREPQLADAMVRALIFADRSVSVQVATVSRLTSTIIVDAIGPGAAGQDAEPGGALLSAVRVIEYTWHAALVGWLSGRTTVAQVTADIRTVCGLLDPCVPVAPAVPGA